MKQTDTTDAEKGKYKPCVTISAACNTISQGKTINEEATRLYLE